MATAFQNLQLLRTEQEKRRNAMAPNYQPRLGLIAEAA
jgi:hypothetical protein